MLGAVEVGLPLPVGTTTELTGLEVLPDANCEQPARAAVTAHAAIVVLNRRRVENKLVTAPSMRCGPDAGRWLSGDIWGSGTAWVAARGYTVSWSTCA
jgi:hypothetical protein